MIFWQKKVPHILNLFVNGGRANLLIGIEFYHQEELRIDREKAEAAIQAVKDYEARLLREDKEMAEQAIRLAKAEEEKREVAKQLAIEAEAEKVRLAEQAKIDEAAAKEGGRGQPQGGDGGPGDAKLDGHRGASLSIREVARGRSYHYR